MTRNSIGGNVCRNVSRFWGSAMTLRVVFPAIILVLSHLCAASPACIPGEAASPTVKANHDLSRLLRNAAKGDRDAQFQAGLRYETGCGIAQDYSLAAHWYLKAADSGQLQAQNSLGGLYLQGRGVKQSDADAMKWYLRAALEGHPAAQNNLGYMYQAGRTGQGSADVPTSTNAEEAVKWYRKAAQSGSAAGELNLGLASFNGTGVRQDLVEAVKWFLKAAAHGSAPACDQLGRVYQHGWGVPPDYAVADKWYRTAIERGYALARQDLATLNVVAQQAGNAPDTPTPSR